MSLISVAASMRRAIGLNTAKRTTRVDQLQTVLPTLRAADASFSIELADGVFGLSSGLAKIGPKGIFQSPLPNDAFARELFAFGWLRHLDAARTAEAEDQARRLLLEWAASPARQSTAAKEPIVMARRVMALLAHAETGLAGAQARDFDRIMNLLGEEAAALTETAARLPMAQPRLTSLIALTAFHVCRAGSDATALARVERRLVTELDRQILKDGGHISRSPAAVLDLALDLLPLRRVYLTARLTAPEAIGAALTRMKAMLRFLQHGDTHLARFNGMGATSMAELATVLKTIDAGTAELTGSHAAADTGYLRLAVGDSLVLFDAGPGPETLAGETPFAGALSFEFSAGTSLLVVNSGSDHQALSPPRLETRATANHSALVLGNTSSAPITGSRSGVARAALETYPGETAPSSIVASTDGYRTRFGYVVRRTLSLLRDGWRLDGVERLEAVTGASTDVPFEVRFHLHPSVYVETEANTGALRLTAGDGSRWAFTAEGGTLALETGTYYAAASGAKPTLQIVVHAKVPETTEIKWKLERMTPGLVS